MWRQITWKYPKLYCLIMVKHLLQNRNPENVFEFIITSSNFMVRKPNKRIFDLPYTEDKNVLTVTDWDELRCLIEE